MAATAVKRRHAGGVRKGAGRKPELSRQLVEARGLAQRLWIGAQQGWKELADEYPSLIALAIRVAKGEDAEGKAVGEPNVPMLRTLLELMPRVVSEEREQEDSPIQRLLGSLKERVGDINLTQHNYYPLGADGARRDEVVGDSAFTRVGEGAVQSS